MHPAYFSSVPAIFASSFVIALSGALMPGPLLVLAVRDTTRRGFAAAPLLVLGHGLLEAALVALVLFGLADWLRGEAATAVIAAAGGGVLLWMGIAMAREIPTLRMEAAGAGGEGGGAERGVAAYGRFVMNGIVASASNPYWIIWWATIGLGYLVLSRGVGRAGVVAFFAGHLLADAAWYLFVGAVVALGRGRWSDRAYRILAGACAASLIVFAFSFGWAGVARLARLM